ncbi:hypothetical protein M885DRAFT_169182 [Pelagophyceae sp. CCMP2097]|nr:hypothetical protein M885DRAFT_169182 [Pelagophyceae sp. CCMP2097]
MLRGALVVARGPRALPLRGFAAKAAPAAKAASPAAAPAAPAKAAPAAAAPAAAPPGEKRLHSTDIAFKPTEDGWGYSPKYSSAYDKIFNKKKTAPAEDAPPAAAAAEEPAAPAAKLDVRDALAFKRILKNHADSADLAAILAECGWTKR